MAKSDADAPTTQRAHTLRLRGEDKNDHSWRDALWATHEAVNKGAKVFGDWLLTLRGGLCHTLADAKVSQGKGKPDRDPTDERRDRRILLALSWLSAESAPKETDSYKAFVIASGKDDSQSSRNEKVVRALREILERRGVKDADLAGWITDCEPSLSAAIRDDAVWVNRSTAFEAACQRVGDSLTRDEVWDMLQPFFGSPEAYLSPLKAMQDSDSDAAPEDKAKDLVQKAGQWLSSRFGTGKGADFAQMPKVYAAIAAWKPRTQAFSRGSEALASLAKSLAAFGPVSSNTEGILALVSGPGYKSATRNILKPIRPTMNATSPPNFRVIADAAPLGYQRLSTGCRTSVLAGRGPQTLSAASCGPDADSPNPKPGSPVLCPQRCVAVARLATDTPCCFWRLRLRLPGDLVASSKVLLLQQPCSLETRAVQRANASGVCR